MTGKSRKNEKQHRGKVRRKLPRFNSQCEGECQKTKNILPRTNNWIKVWKSCASQNGYVKCEPDARGNS